MGYVYATEKPKVFTEDGVSLLLKIRDQTKALIAKALIAKAGVARGDKMMAGCTGDSWTMLACIDRLVELGDIEEIPNTINRAGQYRIFISFDVRGEG